MSFGFFWEASLINLPNSSSSSETQGWLVRSGKMVTKVSMNRWRSPWDTTVNKPVPWLIQMLVCDWAQKIRGQHLSHSIHDLLIQRSVPANSTVPSTPVKNCLLYPSGLCRRTSWRRFFSENELQSLLYQFLLILLYHAEEKNKFTNFKGRKNFFYMYLTSIPGRHKQSCRPFVRTILEDSAIYEFTFNRSTSWFFQLVHFSFCFVLLRC